MSFTGRLYVFKRNTTRFCVCSHTGKAERGREAAPSGREGAAQRALTDAGAAVQQVGAIVMETTPALAVVPAGQVDAAGVVVALDQALRALVDIWGQTSRRQTSNPETTLQVWKITREDCCCCCLLFTTVIFTHCAVTDGQV